MFTIKLYVANRAVRRLTADVIQQAYRAGLYNLPNHSTSWIPAQIEQIAQRFDKPWGSLTTLHGQIARLEDQLENSKVAAQTRQAQIDLVPSRMSPWTITARVLALCGATYLVGNGLAYGLDLGLSPEAWLCLAIAALLMGGPWAVGIPILLRHRAQQAARRTAQQAEQLKQDLAHLTHRLETLRHREAFINNWKQRHIAALLQVYLVAFDAACKARECEEALDQVLPSVHSFDDGPEPPPPTPSFYETNGKAEHHPIDVLVETTH